jgi:hypothetical protein
MQDLVPTKEQGQSWGEAVLQWGAGVYGDIPVRAGRVYKDLANKEYLRAGEDLAPESIRNPMAAWRLYQEGQTARNGRAIWDFDAGEQMRLNEQEAILKGLGFQPDRMAREFEKKKIRDAVKLNLQMARTHWADRWYLAQKQDDLDAKREILHEINAWNGKWGSRHRPDMQVTTKELQEAVKDRQKPINWPTKKEVQIYQGIYGNKD